MGKRGGANGRLRFAVRCRRGTGSGVTGLAETEHRTCRHKDVQFCRTGHVRPA